jgi:hypothetical protein
MGASGGNDRRLLVEAQSPEKVPWILLATYLPPPPAWLEPDRCKDRYCQQQKLRKDNSMPVSASTKMDRFARAAEDVAAAERAIQLEIDRKEKNAPKSSRKEPTRHAGRRANLSGAAVTQAA